MMLSTIFFYLFILFITTLFLIPLVSLLFGFLQGAKGGNDNGFDDFVNSARWIDGK